MILKLTPGQLKALAIESPDYFMISSSHRLFKKIMQYRVDWGVFDILATASDNTQDYILITKKKLSDKLHGASYGF